MVRLILERAVERAPGHATAWAMLSMLYRRGASVRVERQARSTRSLAPGRTTGRRGRTFESCLTSGPGPGALLPQGDLPAFRQAAERTVALNPMDGATPITSVTCCLRRRLERGDRSRRRARRLNPSHPGWDRGSRFSTAIAWRLPRRAPPAAKVNMPASALFAGVVAALRGQFGERDAAAETLQSCCSQTGFPGVARDQFGSGTFPSSSST